MLYHVLDGKYGEGLYIASGDTCYYCNRTAEELYNALSEMGKLEYSNASCSDDFNINNIIIILSKEILCPRGITEDELIIKKLLE
jgi:hypothetical protein